MPRFGVRRRSGSGRDSGYMLLVLMLAVALLTITMLGVGLNYRRSIVRDREVEMIHRGVQYERAVQRYYRKFGNYPPSIEALENTSKVRFLRKRYKDPMSPDGQWQIAHITDIKIPGFGATTGSITGAAGNQPAANGGVASNIQSGAAGTASLSTDGSSTGLNSSSPAVQTTGTGSGSGPADTNGNTSGNTSGNPGNGAGAVLGGGPMLGVMSRSKAEGIHSFNEKIHYNEWYFIYDPSQDTGKGPQLTGPYNPKLSVGVTSTTTTTGTQGGQPGSPATPTSPPPTSSAPPAPAP